MQLSDLTYWKLQRRKLSCHVYDHMTLQILQIKQYKMSCAFTKNHELKGTKCQVNLHMSHIKEYTFNELQE